MARKKLLLLAGVVVAAAVALRRRRRADPVQVVIDDGGSQHQPTADEGTGEGATADVEEDGEGGGDDRAATEEGSAGLESIEGIGPAYGDRLRSANVDDVADLAAADAADLAGETDIAEARIRGWIEQAAERVDA